MKETSQVIREHATDDPVRKCADLGPIRFNGAHGSKMPIESDRGRFDSVDLSAIPPPPPPPPQESFKLRESMGIHVVALAKLNHLIFASRSSSPAAVSCLVWPFLLRLATSCDRVRRGYSDAAYASRLFLFQLRRIVLPGGGDGRDRAAGTRWERALRLVCRRLIGGWQSTVVLVDEDSFHTLSMLAL